MTTEIRVSKENHPLEVVLRSARSCLQHIHYEIETDDRDIIINLCGPIQGCHASQDTGASLEDFRSALNFEVLRYEVSKRTAPLRQLLFGRALYHSCLQIPQSHSGEVSEKT